VLLKRSKEEARRHRKESRALSSKVEELQRRLVVNMEDFRTALGEQRSELEKLSRNNQKQKKRSLASLHSKAEEQRCTLERHQRTLEAQGRTLEEQKRKLVRQRRKLKFLQDHMHDPQPTLISGHTAQICALATKDNLLFSGSRDHTIKVWDMDSNFKLVEELKHHDNSVFTLIVSGQLLVSGSNDKTIRVWSITRHALTGTAIRCDTGVRALAVYNPDGLDVYLYSGDCNGSVKCWSVQTGQCYSVLVDPRASELGRLGGVTKLALFHTTLASSHRNGCIALWDVTDDTQIFRLQSGAPQVRGLALRADMIAYGASDGSISVWDLNEQDAQSASMDPPSLKKTLRGHSKAISQLIFLEDDDQIMSCSGDGAVKVWSIETGECLVTINCPKKRLMCLAVTDDHLICGTCDQGANKANRPSDLVVWSAAVTL